jgi:DNA transposition AAA+ family ATPase
VTDIEFVTTSVAARIGETISGARRLGWNAAIVGQPGVGKTRALEHFAATTPATYLFTVSAISGNAVVKLFRELCGVFKIHDGGTTISDIQHRLFNYDFTGHVLLIDEAQNLKLQAIRELLFLNDLANLSVIFCGNKEVLKRVSTDTGAFAQISSRIPFREDIDCILDADADAIANGFGLEGMDAYGLARKIAGKFHARGVVSVLTLAREFAGSKTLKAPDIRRAIELFPQYRAALR